MESWVWARYLSNSIGSYVRAVSSHHSLGWVKVDVYISVFNGYNPILVSKLVHENSTINIEWNALKTTRSHAREVTG